MFLVEILVGSYKGGLVIHRVRGGVFSFMGLGWGTFKGVGWGTFKVVLEGCRHVSSKGLGLVWLSNTGIGDSIGVKGGVWNDGVCVSDGVDVERVREELLFRVKMVVSSSRYEGGCAGSAHREDLLGAGSAVVSSCRYEGGCAGSAHRECVDASGPECLVSGSGSGVSFCR